MYNRKRLRIFINNDEQYNTLISELQLINPKFDLVPGQGHVPPYHNIDYNIYMFIDFEKKVFGRAYNSHTDEMNNAVIPYESGFKIVSKIKTLDGIEYTKTKFNHGHVQRIQEVQRVDVNVPIRGQIRGDVPNVEIPF